MSKRRDQILAQASLLFAERGFHGVSVNHIGEACGISGPALYKHFSSKDEILAASLTSISSQLLAEGQRRVALATDPTEALASLVDWHVQFALDEPAFIVIQEREWTNLSKAARRDVRALQVDYIDMWVDVLCALRADWDRATARAGAQAVFGLINSTPHSARIDQAGMRKLLTRLALDALTPAR